MATAVPPIQFRIRQIVNRPLISLFATPAGVCHGSLSPPRRWLSSVYADISTSLLQNIAATDKIDQEW